MEFASDRLPQLFAAMLMTLATVILLGPGAPSVLAQHAADQAMARLRVRRSKWSPGPFRSLARLTLRQAQGEDANKFLMLNLSKHEIACR
jgi:hypothetical protein